MLDRTDTPLSCYDPIGWFSGFKFIPSFSSMFLSFPFPLFSELHPPPPLRQGPMSRGHHHHVHHHHHHHDDAAAAVAAVAAAASSSSAYHHLTSTSSSSYDPYGHQSSAATSDLDNSGMQIEPLPLTQPQDHQGRQDLQQGSIEYQ